MPKRAKEQKKITKERFVELLQSALSAEGMDFSKNSLKEIHKAFFTVIRSSLEHGYKVPLEGTGSLRVSVRSARRGINPQTKEIVEYPARNVVRFKASKMLNI